MPKLKHFRQPLPEGVRSAWEIALHFASRYPIRITVGDKEYVYESETHLEGTLEHFLEPKSAYLARGANE